MRQTFRRYNLIVALILLPIVLSLLITSTLLEKLNGNMTRIGGYLESDYGWHGGQLAFDTPLFKKRQGGYEHYSDVVVLGDSFSKNTLWGWPNYFVARTGLTLQFFHFDQGGYERIINSEAFAASPPRLFIVESVENRLKNRFGAAPSACPETPSAAANPVAVRPLHAATHTVTRATETRGLDLDLAADYLGKALPRLFGIETTDTLRVKLTRDDLFSNSKSDHLIAYNHSLAISHWNDKLIADIRCNLLTLQQQTEANGKTRFLFMPIPAKLFAYAAYIEDPRFATLSISDALATPAALNVLRLDTFIPRQIKQGGKDFYLPNDTHWSSHGYQQVADYMIATLRAQKVLK